MKVIAVASQKGGAGKTSSILAIGQGLAHRRDRILYIDMDYQCSLTDMLGGQDAACKTIYDILISNGVQLREGIKATEYGGYIAGSQMMAHLDTLMPGADVDRLRKLIRRLPGSSYDAVLIDTPPALSLPQLMAIHAADTIIIPIQADRQHYQQLKSLLFTINTARQSGCDPTVQYIVTRYNPRVRINQAYYDAIVQVMDAEGIEQLGIVSESSVIREAQGTDADLFADYPKSKPAQEYGVVVDRIAENIRQ